MVEGPRLRRELRLGLDDCMQRCGVLSNVIGLAFFRGLRPLLEE